MAAVDLKSGGQASGAACEIEKPHSLAVALHERNAVKWFDGADEDRGGGPGRFANDIEHEVGAIVEENVHVARGEIHGANPRSRAAEVMSCWVPGWIGFRFHNAAAKASLRKVVDDDFSNEEASELYGISGKFGTAEVANSEFL